MFVLNLAMGTGWAADEHQVKTAVDWETFLSRNDLVWTRMPKVWNEALFLGNGMMGTMVRQSGARAVRWDVGRGDVQDHRKASKKFGYDTCRLPIGFFELKTVGKITGGSMRLDLWNAEGTGTITTDRGRIGWQCFVHAERMAIVVQLDPSDGERTCRWQWQAEPALSPRQTYGRKMRGKYQENPPSQQLKDGRIKICLQPLRAGGETATAWLEQWQDNRSTLIVSVAHSFPETSARQEAVAAVRGASGLPLEGLQQSHRAWWHAYYPASFVSFSDAYWESFYWIQMYKLASTTRADGMMIDNQGPWLQTTPWPGIWWNLNAQLSYWPTYTSNRHDLSKSLERTLYDNVETLIRNVPEAYRADSAGMPRATGQDCQGPVGAPTGTNKPEIGLLLWACHNSWLHYRHTMDDSALRNQLFPLLKRAVNYHLHFIEKDDDGTLHLPPTYSPEYGGGPDCNFDLALLRWGCQALIEASGRLQLADPLLPSWTDVVENLTDYPVDERGYMIARGVPFVKGHRHYSQMLMLYPLYLVNREHEGAEELMLRSVRHWHSMGGRQGYSLTGASSICAAFGRGNEAREYLDGLKPFLQPNTLYKESGPVIETPLSGAQSVHDMLLQSWGGTIRIFPATPDAWGEAAFHDLSAEGAFRVSAQRTAGKTAFVRIKSMAGEPCVIIPGLGGKVQVAGSRTFTLTESKPGRYSLDLKKGEEAILWSGTKRPAFTLAPVAVDEEAGNRFGLK